MKTIVPNINWQAASSDALRTVEINGDGITLSVVANQTHTIFSGKAENGVVPNIVDSLSGIREKLLRNAVNNRTRERNYYQLYSRLLENQITDEEFDRLIEEDMDNYVVPIDVSPSEHEFMQALELAEDLKGVDTMGDLEAIFSFKADIVERYCKD